MEAEGRHDGVVATHDGAHLRDKRRPLSFERCRALSKCKGLVEDVGWREVGWLISNSEWLDSRCKVSRGQTLRIGTRILLPRRKVSLCRCSH